MYYLQLRLVDLVMRVRLPESSNSVPYNTIFRMILVIFGIYIGGISLKGFNSHKTEYIRSRNLEFSKIREVWFGNGYVAICRIAFPHHSQCSHMLLKDPLIDQSNAFRLYFVPAVLIVWVLLFNGSEKYNRIEVNLVELVNIKSMLSESLQCSLTLIQCTLGR